LSKVLSILEGTWEGTGDAGYPTIEHVKYRENLSFTRVGSGDILYYRQVTRIIEPTEQKDELIFDECGFFIEKDRMLKIANAQKSGRVEIYDCTVEESEGTIIISAANVMTNDSKLTRVTRFFKIKDSILTYELKMELINSPGLKTHLLCSLHKVT
jgi:hypothetical protein